MSKPNRFAGLANLGLEQGAQEPPVEAPAPVPAAPPVPAPAAAEASPAPVERLRMLGGRVPDSVFLEFGHAKLDAESTLRLHRVTTEEAVEAFVRLLRDPDCLEKWHAELRRVHAERRG